MSNWEVNKKDTMKTNYSSYVLSIGRKKSWMFLLSIMMLLFLCLKPD